MNDFSDKELLDSLGIEVEIKSKSSLSSMDERILLGYEEIQKFYEKNNRIPENLADRDITERLLALRLQKLLENDDYLNLIRSNILENVIDIFKSKINLKNSEQLDDQNIINSLGLKDNNDITRLKHVRSNEQRRLTDDFAKREVCKEFNEFKPLFERLQKELREGLRNTIDIKQTPEIKEGKFFILGGQKVLVVKIGEIFMQDYGITDARLYLVFDNGTESRMLLRSFQKALTIDISSRFISDPDLGPLFNKNLSDEDQETGTLYILRSYSKIPEIVNNRNLIHKIGFTTGSVQKRIANSKNDPTFLMADVQIIASYKLFNLNSSKFENIVQKIFAHARLTIVIKDRFGKDINPKEWFFVPLEIIQEAVEKIIDGSITEYIYDSSNVKLLKKSS